jgi:hypothetical protein
MRTNEVGAMTGRLAGALFGIALCVSATQALAVTPFEQDVATSIDRGLAYLDNIGAYNNPSSAGDAAGLDMLALLEKRPSGNPADPPQGYSGASAADQARADRVVAFIITSHQPSGFYSYRDGQDLMALSLYLLSGGPNPSVIGSHDVVAAVNAMVDRTLANQNAAGYWCYNNGGCNDSSTTQFAVAGLASAKGLYSNASFSDPGRLASINTELANARQAYVTNSTNANSVGSDNNSCFIVDATEHGHGYHSSNEGYRPSLQQTASGTWVQLLGGATVNDGNAQAYVDWLRNHYRYTDLDSMGNSWPGNSYWYYLWSSFKAMEFIRLGGINPNPGNVGPNDLGLLGPDATCNARQLQRDPATLPQIASFGGGGVGYYSAESKNQYFDYAYSILGYQCPQGNSNGGYYFCNGAPGYWNNYSHQAYAILVLQRATGGACNDSDGDGVCDDVDNCPATPNPNQEDADGDGVGDVCDNCPNTANPDQTDSNGDGIGDACEVQGKLCDVDGDTDVDKIDLVMISRARGQQAMTPFDPRDSNGNGIIDPGDVKRCIVMCTRPGCAVQ